MEEEEAPPAPSSLESPAPAKAWSNYISEELPRSVQESADSAMRSARSLHESSSTHLRSLRVHFLPILLSLFIPPLAILICVLQNFIPQIGTRYTYYEDAFVHKVKGLIDIYPYKLVISLALLLNLSSQYYNRRWIILRITFIFKYFIFLA